MPEQPVSSSVDVLPPIANEVLGISWVVLFMGRWVVVQLLLAARVLSPSMVADLDERVLLRCYLVLVAVTVTVVVLRAMRNRKASSLAQSPMPVNDSAPAPVADRGPGACD